MRINGDSLVDPVETTLSKMLANKEIWQLTVSGRDYPPSYLTRPNSRHLKVANVANTYYEEGLAPRQPDPNADRDTCRFDSAWCTNQVMEVEGVLPIKHSGYEGLFLAVKGGQLPKSDDTK